MKMSHVSSNSTVAPAPQRSTIHSKGVEETTRQHASVWETDSYCFGQAYGITFEDLEFEPEADTLSAVNVRTFLTFLKSNIPLREVASTLQFDLNAGHKCCKWGSCSPIAAAETVDTAYDRSIILLEC